MRIFLLGLMMSLANIASAGTSYDVQNIVLLQPDVILQQRVEAKVIAPYIASLNTAAEKAFAAETYQPTGGFLVIAVKPGKQSAAWLDFQPALPAKIDEKIIARLRAVPPPVREGPVVFAIRVSLDGGSSPQDQTLPHPTAWTEVANRAGRPLEVGELVEQAWPQ